MSALQAKAAAAAAKVEADIKAKAAAKEAKAAAVNQKKADAAAAKAAEKAAKAAAKADEEAKKAVEKAAKAAAKIAEKAAKEAAKATEDKPKRPRGRPRKDGLPPGSKTASVVSAGGGESQRRAIFQYMFRLQERGTVNMLGAGASLKSRFGLTEDAAEEYVTEYISHYDALKAKYDTPPPAAPSLLPPGEDGEIAALRAQIAELRMHVMALQGAAAKVEAIRTLLV